jgi:hypothetical protein
MAAVANLRRGLRMEVKLVPEPLTSSLMGLMALAIRRHALAVEHGLEKVVFQLPVQRTGKTEVDSSPTLPRKSVPSSDSQNLPRTGGGRHRMAAWRRNLLIGKCLNIPPG